jgi:hypothetical protein
MKALIPLILALSTSAHAKMFYFKDFAADFPNQPKVEVTTYDYGAQSICYSNTYNTRTSTCSVGVRKYISTQPFGLQEIKAFHYGQAHGAAINGEVTAVDTTFNGYPALAMRYRDHDFYAVLLQIYVNTSTYYSILVLHTRSEAAAVNLYNKLISSFVLRLPEIRPAIPVTDDARDI